VKRYRNLSPVVSVREPFVPARTIAVRFPVLETRLCAHARAAFNSNDRPVTFYTFFKKHVASLPAIVACTRPCAPVLSRPRLGRTALRTIFTNGSKLNVPAAAALIIAARPS